MQYLGVLSCFTTTNSLELHLRMKLLAWTILAVTQCCLLLHILVNAMESVSRDMYNIIYAICDLPVPSSTFLCQAFTARDLHSHRVDLSLTAGYTGPHISIDDAVFMVKGSKMACSEQLVGEFNGLEVESVAVNTGLMELRVHAYGSVDL